MDNTLLIEVTNQKAMKLLHELEKLSLIKVLKKNIPKRQTKLSEKYKGVFTIEDAKSFDEHTQTMREEWKDI